MNYSFNALVQRRDAAIGFGISEFDGGKDSEASRFFGMAVDIQSLIKSLYYDD